MDAAVIGKAPHFVEFVGIFEARLMDIGIPLAGWISGCARGGTMKARVPIPLDLVAGFDGDRLRRKIIATASHVNDPSLGERGLAEKKKEGRAQSQSAVTRYRFHVVLTGKLIFA